LRRRLRARGRASKLEPEANRRRTQDREAIVQGTVLLGRRDVFEAVTALASSPPIYVTVVDVRRPAEDD
jgi:hypothetical protein